MPAVVKGGHKMDAMLRKFASAQSSTVKVGLLSTATYPNGESVARVAAQNEFGHGRVPARPFMRQALPGIEAKAAHMGGPVVSPAGTVRKEALAALGEMAVGEIQESITQLDRPPNAPFTIRMKGSSNPLIDTGVLRRSVAYEVV